MPQDYTALAARDFAAFLGCPPDRGEAEDLRRNLLIHAMRRVDGWQTLDRRSACMAAFTRKAKGGSRMAKSGRQPMDAVLVLAGNRIDH